MQTIDGICQQHESGRRLTGLLNEVSLQCSSIKLVNHWKRTGRRPGRYGECAILMHLHELGRDPVILGKLLKG